MAKVSLIITGAIFLLATFIVLEVYLDTNSKSDIRTANSLCTAQVNFMGFTVPIGSWGQRLLGAEADCQKVHYLMLLITYGWIGYAFGGFLLVLGLVLGNRRREHHEEREERHEHHQHSQQKHISKFCGNCGGRLGKHSKYCHKCGEEV